MVVITFANLGPFSVAAIELSSTNVPVRLVVSLLAASLRETVGYAYVPVTCTLRSGGPRLPTPLTCPPLSARVRVTLTLSCRPAHRPVNGVVDRRVSVIGTRRTSPVLGRATASVPL